MFGFKRIVLELVGFLVSSPYESRRQAPTDGTMDLIACLDWAARSRVPVVVGVLKGSQAESRICWGGGLPILTMHLDST